MRAVGEFFVTMLLLFAFFFAVTTPFVWLSLLLLTVNVAWWIHITGGATDTTESWPDVIRHQDKP